jgi:pimeloyl-ACP methyl ester carboxylesterase
MDVSRLDVEGAEIQLRRWHAEADANDRLLFLHSLGPASSAAFLDLGAAPLTKAGIDLAAPDLPGFGGSPPVDADSYAVDALAELAWDVADELAWPELILMGHSWGGAIACHAAAARPDRVRALVLVDSGHLDYGDQPGVDLNASMADLVAESEERRFHADDREDVARELEVDVADPLVDAFFEGLEDDGTGKLVSRTLPTPRAAVSYHLMRARQSETWPAIAAAAIPTLLLLATIPEEARAQNETGAAAFARAIPQATVRFLGGASHSVITDLREDFGTAVAEWLATVLPR